MAWNQVIRPTSNSFTWAEDLNMWEDETRIWGINSEFSLVSRPSDAQWNSINRPS